MAGFQFEVIPEWVPSGVLALRSPRKAQLGKYTTKRTGKLLATALHSVKNLGIREGRRSGGDNGRSSSVPFPYSSLTKSLSNLPSTSILQQQPRHTGQLNALGPFPSKTRSTMRTVLDLLNNLPNVSCWKSPASFTRKYISQILTRYVYV